MRCQIRRSSWVSTRIHTSKLFSDRISNKSSFYRVYHEFLYVCNIIWLYIHLLTCFYTVIFAFENVTYLWVLMNLQLCTCRWYYIPVNKPDSNVLPYSDFTTSHSVCIIPNIHFDNILLKNEMLHISIYFNGAPYYVNCVPIF